MPLRAGGEMGLLWWNPRRDRDRRLPLIGCDLKASHWGFTDGMEKVPKKFSGVEDEMGRRANGRACAAG